MQFCSIPTPPALQHQGIQSFSHVLARRIGFSGLPLSTLVILHLPIQAALHRTAAGGSVACVFGSLLLQGALTCPNEMIRYDKNLEPIPMFDHRISSYIIVVHSGCFFVSSLCIPARSLGFARLFLDSSCMFLPITCPMDFASGISSLALGLVGCNLWICKGLGKVWRGLVRFTDLVHEFVAHSVLGDAW